MPVSPTYPGVYVEEVPSEVRTITGVATSITAFIGRAKRGPVDKPTPINSFGDFQRQFGGLWEKSSLGFAVKDFYLNGGSQAIIVRVFNPYFQSEEDLEESKTFADSLIDIIKEMASEEKLQEWETDAERAANDIFTKASNEDDFSLKPLELAAAREIRDFIQDLKETARTDKKKEQEAEKAKEDAHEKIKKIQSNSSLSKLEKDNAQAVFDAVVDGADNAPKTLRSVKLKVARKLEKLKEEADPYQKVQAIIFSIDKQAEIMEASDENNIVETAVARALYKIARKALTRRDLTPELLRGEVEREESKRLLKLASSKAKLFEAVEKIVGQEDVDSLFGKVANNIQYFVEQSCKKESADVREVVSSLVDKRGNNFTARSNALLKHGALSFKAVSPGAWGNKLQLSINHDVKVSSSEEEDKFFNLSVRDGETGEVETFNNLTLQADHPHRIDKVLKNKSLLIRMTETFSPSLNRPDAHTIDKDVSKWKLGSTGNTDVDDKNKASDGNELIALDIIGNESQKTGLYALEDTNIFNLLCIPPYKDLRDIDKEVRSTAMTYCERKRAFFLADPPSDWSKLADAKDGIKAIDSSKNASIFFPRLKEENLLQENQIEEFSPCGAIAGIFARTDAERGVWKAPAGLDSNIRGIVDFSVSLGDKEIGELNPLGVNCLRRLPGLGRPVIWGSRTLEGDDRLASEWKHISVRRLALYIEESLYRGLLWAVYEPNDEPLWSQIRLNVGAFMNNLFRQGAFQGKNARDAYLVKCDAETTTQYDVDRGIVNIVVGFAPLKPAEFVILKLQQLTGQSTQ